MRAIFHLVWLIIISFLMLTTGEAGEYLCHRPGDIVKISVPHDALVKIYPLEEDEGEPPKLNQERLRHEIDSGQDARKSVHFSDMNDIAFELDTELFRWEIYFDGFENQLRVVDSDEHGFQWSLHQGEDGAVYLHFLANEEGIIGSSVSNEGALPAVVVLVRELPDDPEDKEIAHTWPLALFNGVLPGGMQGIEIVNNLEDCQ